MKAYQWLLQGFFGLCQKTPWQVHFLLAVANIWVTATVNQKYSQAFLLFFPSSVTSKWWTAEVLVPWDMNLCSTSCDSRIQSTFPCIIKLVLFLLLYLLKGIYTETALTSVLASVENLKHRGFSHTLMNILISIELQISFLYPIH